MRISGDLRDLKFVLLMEKMQLYNTITYAVP